MTIDTAAYLNVADPGFSLHSEEVRRARDLNWYARTNYGVAVLRYDQVSRLLNDRHLRQGSWAWPQHHGITTGPFVAWWQDMILNLEDEDHHRLRRLLNPAFSRKLVNDLVPRFQALADELVDQFHDSGQCEFVSQFSEPYAARVIAIMLGIPESEWRTLAAWSAEIGLGLGVTIAQDLPRIEAALAGLYGYADELIADRSAHPRDDFVTRLVDAERDGERLSREELRNALVTLVFGGMDTTRHQLGLAVQTFAQHPEQWRLLADRPELGGKAVEEVMRVNPTVTWVTREALDTFTLDGLEIERGTTVHLFCAAAGTDPAGMDDTSFDLLGDRPPHLGFGGGAHHCLGHFVARSDMSEALPLLARRLRSIRIGDDATWLPGSGNTGAITLPISFTPGR